MKKINLVIVILLGLLIIFGVSLFLHNQIVDDPVVEQAIPDLLEEPLKRPIVRYPVPEPAPEVMEDAATLEEEDPAASVGAAETKELDLPATVPAVEASDTRVEQALAGVFGSRIFSTFFIIDNFIQRLVLTIDNLPEKKLPVAHVPFKFPEGKFMAGGDEQSLRISSQNYQRYAPYIALLENVDPDLLIKTYVHFYPLLQTAYEQLGYPNAYFNDRLVHVIEHLLATPNPADPLALEQPSVLYTYADPALEELSSGQKILLRMGQEQRLRSLSMLRNYHFRLTNLLP